VLDRVHHFPEVVVRVVAGEVHFAVLREILPRLHAHPEYEREDSAQRGTWYQFSRAPRTESDVVEGSLDASFFSLIGGRD